MLFICSSTTVVSAWSVQLISIELNIEHGLFLRMKMVLEIDGENTMLMAEKLFHFYINSDNKISVLSLTYSRKQKNEDQWPIYASANWVSIGPGNVV